MDEKKLIERLLVMIRARDTVLNGTIALVRQHTPQLAEQIATSLEAAVTMPRGNGQPLTPEQAEVFQVEFENYLLDIANRFRNRD